MGTTEMTLNEIRARGRAALLRELGPVGYVRFIQQFEAGSGDYTAERAEWADKTSIEQLRQDLRKEK
jgi:hypothetical protein